MIEFSEINLKQMRDLLPEINHVGVIDGKVVPMTNRVGEVHSFSDLMEISALKKDIEALQAERVNLELHIENLSYHIACIANASKNNSGHEPSLSCFHRAIDEAQDAVEILPQHHLAAHDSEVAKAAFVAGIRLRSQGSCNDWHKAAEEYAVNLNE